MSAEDLRDRRFMDAIRSCVARAIVGVDELWHKLPMWIIWHSRTVCLAADVVYGWGPEASDWDEAKNRPLIWLHRFLWPKVGASSLAADQGEK